MATAGVPVGADRKFPARVRVKALDAQNPFYATFGTTWNDIDVLNESGERLRLAAHRFLAKRPKEQIDIYQERLRNFFSTPLLGTIIGWYSSALFRRQPAIETPGEDEFFTAFLDDCDHAATKYTEHWRRCFEGLLLYGRCWTLVDKPSTGDLVPESRAQEQDLGLDAPYLVSYDPRQVINWGVDKFGNLDWVVTKTLDTQAEFLADDAATMTHWTYYDRARYARYEAQSEEGTSQFRSFGASPLPDQEPMAKLIESGPHALSGQNAVPFTLVTVPNNLWLANRAFAMLKQYVNQENSYSWGLYMGNLEMPVIFTGGSEPNMTRSEASYWVFDQKDRVEWSGPSGRTFQNSAAYIDALREDIYRAFYLQAQGRSSRATASAQSGYSKQMDMMPSNDVLNAYGDIVRQGMEATLNMVAKARGMGDEALSTVTGFRFEWQPATQSIATADEFSALNIQSDSAQKAMQKRVVRDVFQDERAEDIEKFVAEIDAAPTASQVASQQQDKQTQFFQQNFDRLSDRATVRDELASVGQ